MSKLMKNTILFLSFSVLALACDEFDPAVGEDMVAIEDGEPAAEAVEEAVAAEAEDENPAGAAASLGERAARIEGVDYIDPARPHCVTNAFSASEIEAGRDVRMRQASCFATFAQAMRSIGATEDITSPTDPVMFPYQNLAVHCDGYLGCYKAVATLSIKGNDCNGGGLVFSSAWDDRLDSTLHKRCNRVSLYSAENYTGVCNTDGKYDLDAQVCEWMRNRNEAVKYFGPVN